MKKRNYISSLSGEDLAYPSSKKHKSIYRFSYDIHILKTLIHSSASFKEKHTINKLDRRNPNSHYPMAHTCFFTLDLPAYTTEDSLREHLLYAIHNCQDIDADDTTRAQQAANR